MRSILFHVYDDAGLDGRVLAAIDLARAFSGHITCLHATPFEDYLRTDPWVAARLPEEFSAKMEKARLELQARVEKRLRQEDVQWDWVHQNDRMSAALIRYSILSDIVVVTQAVAAFERHEPRPLAAVVATGSRAPVLAVPEALRQLDLQAPIVIAWNGSPEAAAAMRASVPLLRLASKVHLLEVQEKLSRYPRDLAARYLSRHDIHVEIVQKRPSAANVSDEILRAATGASAGLIVMGAYGHSRLREFILGGVTRDLIANGSVPVFLAH